MLHIRTVALLVIIAFTAGLVSGALVIRKYQPCAELPIVTIQRDTVTVMDTTRGQAPEKSRRVRVRTDTVRIEITPTADSTRLKVNDSV